MGSAASTSIKRIDDNDGNEHDTKFKSTEKNTDSTKRNTSLNISRAFNPGLHTKVIPVTNELGEEKNDIQKLEELLKAAEKRATDAEEKAKEIEQQMAEVECQKLNLMDKLSSLEEEVESLQRTAIREDWSNTLEAKEKYIVYLEGQVQKSDIQINTLKRKFRKKLRFLNRQLSEAKQSHSVMSLEQQQERQSLIEENNKLKEQLRKLPQEANVVANEITDNRTKIILELSSRISEQELQISELEGNIQKKETEIESLRTQIKELKSSSDNKCQSPGERYTEGYSSTVRMQSSQSHLAQHSRKQLKQEQKDKDAMDSLEMMTEDRKDTWDDNQEEDDHGVVDDRQSSGISRDSGVLTMTQQMANSGNRSSDSDWADSDIDSDISEQHLNNSRSSSANHHRDSTGDKMVNSSTGADGHENLKKLDPSSIRRISAAKLRKKKQINQRPPLNRDNFRFKSGTDNFTTSSSNIETEVTRLLHAY